MSMAVLDRRADGFGSRLAVVMALVVSVLTGYATAQELGKDLTLLLGRSQLGSASVSVCLIDVETGRELASYRKDERMTPASNLKLLTSGSALAVLGADYEFRTQLEMHGKRLVIKGSGDPAFADPVLLDQMHISLDTFLDKLVESVVNAGVKSISEVVVDDRVFDREYVHPDWPRDQLDKGYCAEVSGLTFHANVLSIYASPGSRDGEPAVIRTEPDGGGIEVKVRARTARGGANTTKIGAVRQASENMFTISGTVNAALKEPAQTTMHESSVVFARLLADRLARGGVTRDGEADPLTASGHGAATSIPARLVGEDEELGSADSVLTVVRTPISVVMERCNRDSENLYAESLLKLLGKTVTGQRGSWTSGTSVVRMQVKDRVGPEAASSLFLSDGSGMSRTNKVTASLLASWLANLSKDPKVGAAYVDSLPRAKQEGTMARRFRDKQVANEVRGKSGLLNGVRSLSGYVTNLPTGRRVVYSVLVNDIPGDVSATKVKEFHEDVVLLCDRWLTRECKGSVQPDEKLGGGESRSIKKSKRK